MLCILENLTCCNFKIMLIWWVKSHFGVILTPISFITNTIYKFGDFFLLWLIFSPLLRFLLICRRVLYNLDRNCNRNIFSNFVACFFPLCFLMNKILILNVKFINYFLCVLGILCHYWGIVPSLKVIKMLFTLFMVLLFTLNFKIYW